jgi:putative flippase GtrA
VLRKELLRFATVGVVSVAISYVVYRALIFAAIGKDLSNGLAYCAALCLSFFANRSWTFGSREIGPTAIVRFVALHVLSLFACIFVNSVTLNRLSNITGGLEAAFIFGVGTSATINFIGMRRWVFAGGALR